jgi:hypothetical protein
MRVLDLEGYNAILGMDWLQQHSPMTTDWDKKFISFPYNGRQVTLYGVPPITKQTVAEIHVQQLAKWSKGNDIWAIAVIHPVPMLSADSATPDCPVPVSSPGCVVARGI